MSLPEHYLISISFYALVATKRAFFCKNNMMRIMAKEVNLTLLEIRYVFELLILSDYPEKPTLHVLK